MTLSLIPPDQSLINACTTLALKCPFVLGSISDADGNLVVQEVAVKPLTQDLLNPEVRNQPSDLKKTPTDNINSMLNWKRCLNSLKGVVSTEKFHTAKSKVKIDFIFAQHIETYVP